MRSLLGATGRGWKTYAVGVTTIVIGLAGAVLYFANPESEHALPISDAIEMILGGLALLGIRHALEPDDPTVENEPTG